MSLLAPDTPPSFEAALRDVGSRDARARYAAVIVLAEAGGDAREAACLAVRPRTEDDEAAVRFAALAAIGKLVDVEALDRVLARFEDTDPGVREAAVITAARLGDLRAERPLLRALTDARPEVRYQAVVSCAELLGEDARAALLPLVADEDAKVRANTLAALATLGAHAATAERVVRALSDTVQAVQLEAAFTLAALGDGRGARVLIGALRDDERGFEAMDALGALGAEGALTHALARNATDALAPLATAFLGPALRKAAAAAALVRLGDPRGLPVLRTLLGGFRDAATRDFVLGVVEALRLTALSAEVRALVEKPHAASPERVFAALAALAPKDPSALEALERAAREPGPRGELARVARGRVDARPRD